MIYRLSTLHLRSYAMSRVLIPTLKIKSDVSKFVFIPLLYSCWWTLQYLAQVEPSWCPLIVAI
jgi:hypothetical protein